MKKFFIASSLVVSNLTLAAGPAIQSSNVSISTSSLDAIASASPVVQLTLLILISLSVVCWAVGIAKYRQFQRVAAANEPFLKRFWKTQSMELLYGDCDQFRGSSIARVFKAGYLEYKDSGSQSYAAENIERALRKAVDIEVADMESRLTLLATTGSTGPFIGLFGTVWGIMGSFHKIGATGNASLAVVAPGISEALIATAIGLAAAIPAVVLYNNFIARIRREEIALGNFTTDFLNIIKRSKGV
jgi:biopolymer transport protein TolQ